MTVNGVLRRVIAQGHLGGTISPMKESTRPPTLDYQSPSKEQRKGKYGPVLYSLSALLLAWGVYLGFGVFIPDGNPQPVFMILNGTGLVFGIAALFQKDKRGAAVICIILAILTALFTPLRIMRM